MAPKFDKISSLVNYLMTVGLDNELFLRDSVKYQVLKYDKHGGLRLVISITPDQTFQSLVGVLSHLELKSYQG